YLQSSGGGVSSSDGLGLTADMAAATGYNQVTALNAMLVRLEAEGVVKRDVRGKRTYAISLAKRRAAANTSGRTSRKSSQAAPRSARAKRSPNARGARTGATSDIALQVAALRREVDALARNIRGLEKTLTKKR